MPATVTKSYDRVPGGTFDTQAQIKEQGEKSSWGGNLIHVQNFSNVVNNHSFIPTVSALALTNSGSRDWSENLSARNLICTAETPFDDYFTPTNNEEHVFLSEENVSWIKTVITGNFQDCVDVCLPVSISGAEYLCEPVSNTFALSGIPPNAEILWETNLSNIVTINSPNDAETKLTKIGNGIIILKATVTNACSGLPVIVSKQIKVGTPAVDGGFVENGVFNLMSFDEMNPNIICAGNTISTQITIVNGTGPSWSRAAAMPANNTWSQTGNNINFYFWGAGQSATFKMSTSNNCGTVERWYPFESINCGGGGGDPCDQFIVSPNPAISNIIVYVPNIPPPCDPPVISKASNKNAERGITQLRLFENTGILKKQQSTAKTKQSSMNISGLTPGIYYLEISDGAYKERQKVVIQ